MSGTAREANVYGRARPYVTDSRLMCSTSGPKRGRVHAAIRWAQGWLSIGKEETFGISDLGRMRGWTRKVRKFHEVEGTWPHLQRVAVGGIAVLLAGLVHLVMDLFD